MVKASWNQVHKPCAGNRQHHLETWRKLISDPWVLETITGYYLEYDCLPEQTEAPKLPPFSNFVKQLIDDEIVTLKSKGAIKEVSTCWNEFLSNIFLVPKKTGDTRSIVNKKNHWIILFKKWRTSPRLLIPLALETTWFQLPLKSLILFLVLFSYTETQRCCQGSFYLLKWVSFKYVSGTQENWWYASSFQLETIESFCSGNTFQNGERQHGFAFYYPMGL